MNDKLIEQSVSSVWLVDCFYEKTIHYTKKSADEYVNGYKLDGGEPVVTVLYTSPQLYDAEAKLKLAIEALQGLIASVKGYRKNIQDNQPCDAEVFAKQALEKIGE